MILVPLADLKADSDSIKSIPGWWAGPSVGAEAGWAVPPEAVAEGAEGCGSPAAVLRGWWRKASVREWGEGWGIQFGETKSARWQDYCWCSDKRQGLVSGESEGSEWQDVGWCWRSHSVVSLLSSSGPRKSLGSPPPGCWRTAASLRWRKQNWHYNKSGDNSAINSVIRNIKIELIPCMRYVNNFAFPQFQINTKKTQKTFKSPRENKYCGFTIGLCNSDELYYTKSRKCITGWNLYKNILQHERFRELNGLPLNWHMHTQKQLLFWS